MCYQNLLLLLKTKRAIISNLSNFNFIHVLSKVLPKSSITFENQKSNYIQPQQFQFHTLLIDSLNNQIDSLKSEVHFLREEIREKNNIIKHLLKNNNFDLQSNESIKQPKSNNLKLLSNESISNTN